MRINSLIPDLPQAEEKEIGDEGVEEHTGYRGCVWEGLVDVGAEVRQGCVDLLH